jgi:hypothetical protein
MTHAPDWLSETVNRVARQFRAADPLAPIGCHFFHDEFHDVWEVTVFVSRTETLGGELDGKLTSSRFSVDLNGLETLFSEVHSQAWQAVSLGEDDDLGPHLAVEGLVGEHKVWLRILADAPRQFEAGRIADVYGMEFHDRW